LNGRLQGGANAPIFFELAGEVGGLLVTQTGRRFLDGGTSAQEFYGLMLSLVGQPDLGFFAHLLEEVAAQGVPGDAAPVRQRGGGPVGLSR